VPLCFHCSEHKSRWRVDFELLSACTERRRFFHLDETTRYTQLSSAPFKDFWR
jgi:hypothetical protein